jgi:hypothetical protein
MDLFQIPKRQAQARILLDDGRSLDSTMFLALSFQERRPETIADRLNDTSEEFLPVAVGQDRFLLNKSGIITVQISDPAELADAVDAGAREPVVRLTLAGGTGLVGKLRITMPAERSRVLDYLNASPRFLPLLTGTGVTLVHRRFIVSVRSEIEGE